MDIQMSIIVKIIIVILVSAVIAQQYMLSLYMRLLRREWLHDEDVDTFNKWIPVNERLPEDKIDVIVTIKEVANETGGYRYYTRTSWLQEGQWVFKRSQYEPKVIAWQPLPEPWEEAK